MKLNRVNSAIDRNERNKINENFDIIERGFGKTALDAQYAVETSDEAKHKAESVQTQFNQVVIEGDSSIEAAQARVSADAIVYDTLKSRLDAENLQVTQRLEQINTNPVLKNENSEFPTLSEELITTGLVTLGSGWSGNFESGFTHTAGYTENLIIDIPSIESNAIYQVEVLATNPAIQDTGQSDYWVTLGGSIEFETYKGQTARHVWGIKTINGTTLVIRPWENYSGTLTLSVKKALTVSAPYAIYQDSEELLALEQRVSKSNANSFYLGKYSGQFSNEFAEQNIGLGNFAMQNNTSGFWNVWLGYEALRDNTVGTRNVALGRISLANNISGDRNVAIGSWALTRNTTGRGNIGIGADSAHYVTSGNHNIGIGTYSLGHIANGNNNIALGESVMGGATLGNHNVAIGRAALYYNKGVDNIAIGNNSQYRNQTGTDNIGIGENSNFFNESGNNNVAIGKQSLYNNKASDNIAFGYKTLKNNIDGSQNVAIGANAGGQDGVTLSNLNRNVLVGYNAGAMLSGDSERNVIIGSHAGMYVERGSRNILIGYAAGTISTTLQNDYLNIGNVIKSNMTTGVIEMQKVKLTALPTTVPTETGMLWNDGGTLKIS